VTGTRTGLTVLAVVAALGAGCAHAPKTGGYSRFVQGNVPDYDGAWKDLNRPPDESLHHFIARVRRLAATTRPVKSFASSLESTDPVLRDSLAALALAPTAVNHWRVGEAYRHAKVLDRALDHFGQAVKLDTRLAAGWDGLARTWRDWGVPEYALADASRAVFFAPEEPAYRNTLGTILQALGRWSEARAAYTSAEGRAPGAAWVLNNLCALDLAVGDAAEAKAQCAAAMAADRRLRIASENYARAEAALASPPTVSRPANQDAPARAATRPDGPTPH
jgi:tetratricopeptide (TPR) repeat protein